MPLPHETPPSRGPEVLKQLGKGSEREGDPAQHSLLPGAVAVLPGAEPRGADGTGRDKWAAGAGISAEAPSCPARRRAPAAKNLGGAAGPWGAENLAGAGLGVPVSQPSSEPAGVAPVGKFGCWRGMLPANRCSEAGDAFSRGVRGREHRARARSSAAGRFELVSCQVRKRARRARMWRPGMAGAALVPSPHHNEQAQWKSSRPLAISKEKKQTGRIR